jgi:hypothetical protein
MRSTYLVHLAALITVPFLTVNVSATDDAAVFVCIVSLLLWSRSRDHLMMLTTAYTKSI